MDTDGKFPSVSQMFNLLNDWRHLPSYSLETRAAPFFAVFMRDVLSSRFGHEIHEILIPEFPLRIGTLYNDEECERLQPVPSANQSYNVDYVAFAKNGRKIENKRTAYLVELKTDMESRRPQQDRYLYAARKKGLPALVKGVRKISKKSKKKQKYVNLLSRLSAPGIDLVTIPDDAILYEKTFPNVVRGWTDAVNQLKIADQVFSNVEIVYVQPTKEGRRDELGFNYIYFDEVASVVERRGDLGAMFANYLRQWKKPAGSRDPRKIPLPP